MDTKISLQNQNEINKINWFRIIPEDVLFKITDFLVPENRFDTKKIIINYGYQLLCINLSLKILKDNLLKMKERFHLISKYSKYNTDYQFYYKSNPYKVVGNPILLDILFTECNLPYADSTFEYFSEQIEKDLKRCIELFPNSINSTFGVLRCRYDVSPLHAACFNSNVPLRIIKHLIENGADTKHPISVNGDKINILDDLDDNNNFRSESIRKFLFKHKLNI